LQNRMQPAVSIAKEYLRKEVIMPGIGVVNHCKVWQ
jgi:hypothetical protein